MKLSWSCLLASLYASASASSSPGRVFTYDSSHAAVRPAVPAVGPETARLILAQRLGVSRYHSIKRVDDETIRLINEYGGPRQRLFRDEPANQARVLIWIDDADVSSLTHDIIKAGAGLSPDLEISNPPTSSDNERLIQDLLLQAESLPKKADPQNWAHTTSVEVEAELMQFKQTDSYNVNGYLSIFHANKDDKVSQSALAKSIAKIIKSNADNKDTSSSYSLTIVLMPPVTANTKRTAQPYGTYDIPANLEARRDKTEMLLSPSASEPSPEPNNSLLDDTPAVQISQANDSSPVLGILPSCFNSLEICEKTTHSCSGRGSCGILHNGTGQGSSATAACFGCRCRADVKEIGESKSKKTTVWGGPACQKKDVSVPFWLFVGSGVLLAFLISAGIGLLYSMGSEELPSVIGAGVSGPTRK